MQLVIIAGGKGTRLGLDDIPKPMVEIGGYPLLVHQIELAKKYGISEIFIISGFLSQKIKEYFGSGENFGVKIHHITEKMPLGTAGGLKLIEDKLNERFLVFYGDIFMNFDIQNFIDFDLKHKNSIGSLIVHPNNHPFDSDLIEINNDYKVKKILFKPHPPNLYYKNLSIAAIFMFSKEILYYIEKNKKQDLVKDVINKALMNDNNIYAYETSEYIKDIGTKERLEEVTSDYKSKKPEKLNRENKRPCIFLDRDGVINENMDIKPSVKKFKLISGVDEAVKLINKSGYYAVVVTNQPMIAKGFITIKELELIHKKMETLLGENGAYIDRIYYCPHHPDIGFDGEIKNLKKDCDCRKPKPGMLYQAEKELNIDLQKSYMIGDNEIDLIAGKNAGCKTIYISEKKSKYADLYAKNLLNAIKIM